MEKLVSVDYPEDKIACITLNRTDKANALNEAIVSDLYEALLSVEKTSNVIIIRGGEKCFSAGVDVSGIASRTYDTALSENFMDERWTYLERVQVPVISVVEGLALGGGFELSLMTDIIIAGKDAKFSFPEVNLGIMPGLGGTRKLFDLVGAQQAFEIIATGKMLSADEAYSCGIVSHLSDDPYRTAVEIAQKMSEKPKSSILSIKRMFKFIKNKLYSADLCYERELFMALFSSSDKLELTQRFLKK